MARAAFHFDDELEQATGLSDIDKALISLLQIDGRAPYVELARQLGTTEKHTRQRVEELRANGVMQITTVSHPALMGYQAIALVCIGVDRAYSVDAVGTILTGIPGAFYVAAVTGRFDIVVELYCSDLDELRETVDTQIRHVPGVTATEIFPYLQLHYRFPAFGAESDKRIGRAVALGPQVVEEPLDTVDREILSLLHHDGRMSFRDVARQIDVSEKQVRRRVKRLTDGGAMKVMALTRPSGIGFNTAAFVMITVHSGEQIGATAEALAGLPGVIYVASCIGRFDVMAEVVCTDVGELFNVLDDGVRRVPGVARAEVWQHLGLHYRPVRPRWETVNDLYLAEEPDDAPVPKRD